MDECDTFCSEALSRGFATIALQGIASADDESRSWHGFGSTNSSTDYLKDAYNWTGVSGCDASAQDAENGRTCNLDAYTVQCTDDCNDQCLDGCWWTTCQDSVGQTLGVLRYFMEQFCINETMIWATGRSNGGMFLYELAHDERSTSLFAGVAPMVGLPHYGFNFGPRHNMSFFGSRGLSDDVVPPEENPSDLGCSLSCRTSQSEGWFFTSSKCATEKWAEVLGLENYEDVGDFGYDENESCWSYSSSTTSIEVVGCHFNGGHYGDHADYQIKPILDFMESHPKIDMIQAVVPTNSPSGSASTLEPSSAVEMSTGSPSGVSPLTPSPTDKNPLSAPTASIVLSNTPTTSLSESPTSLEPLSSMSSMAPSSDQLEASTKLPSSLEPSTTLSSFAPSSQQLEVVSTIGPLTTRPSTDIVSSETTSPSSSQFPSLNGVLPSLVCCFSFLSSSRSINFFCKCINHNLHLHTYIS